jgi:glycosyltransferase involved in cell wall biosynthesis
MINLHVMHSWGGGLERWVQDYTQSDQQDTNLVLKSIGEKGVPARQIHLYQKISDLVPSRSWKLDKPILATAAKHLEYRYILQEIIDVFHVDNIIISSLIGHALELLGTNLSVSIVCHDFYPFCPVIVAYFKGNCQKCNFSHLKDCFDNNPIEFFPFTSAIEWMEIRNLFVDTLIKQQISLIMPSPFMKDRLISLEPKLANANMIVISHGISSFKRSDMSTMTKLPPIKKKPRIAILGDLADHKGLDLFRQICDQLCELADIYLIGCGESGYIFKNNSRITIIARYQREELSTILENLDIELGLLLSIWTETFSYTLSELMLMGIPTLATNIGSFADRIQDGINGFLVNPDPEDIVSKVNLLLGDSDMLKAVRNNLVKFEHKSVESMVNEYQLQFSANLLDRRKIITSTQLDILPDVLNLEKIYMEIQLGRQEVAELRLEQSRLLTRLEYKEFYPDWKISKKIYKPMSERLKILKGIKIVFPDTWHYLRNLALRLKILR